MPAGLVVTFLAAQFAVRVAFWLPFFVETIGDGLLEVVFFDPGQDMFGVKRDCVGQGMVCWARGEGAPNRLDALVQEELARLIVELAQGTCPCAFCR